MKIRVLLAAAAVVVSLPAAAQPRITVDPEVACVPEGPANGIVWATVEPESALGGNLVRLYFRWQEHGDPYFVDMIPVGGGRYWGVPAKPEPRNERIEFYVAVIDPSKPPGDPGSILSQTPTMQAPVTDDCRIPLGPLSPALFEGAANNLTVGETVADQEGRRILGFLCDGVVTRINSYGILRPDEICRACVVAWNYIEPLLAVPPLGFICCIEPPQEEASPSRPSGN